MRTQRHKQSEGIFLDRRLTANVPEAFDLQVRIAALLAGITVADLVRSALSDRLDRSGIRHMRLPHLQRFTRKTRRIPTPSSKRHARRGR